jgi:signal peptidase I
VSQQLIVRYSFMLLWFFVIPAAFALVAVNVSQASDLFGALGAWVREQYVPALIIFFTAAEMTLYYFRHSLPHATASSGPSDLPKELRREFETAIHLVDEARRIQRKNERAVAREVSKESRDRLQAAIDRLDAATHKSPFDAAEFRRAFDVALDLVDQLLAPWRKSETREYIESIGVAVLVALSLRACVVEAFKIPSGSMLPTLQIGDHIFVNKFVYGPHIPFTESRLWADMPPERGDVMVFEFPEPEFGQEVQDFIKRVIALPGDVLEAEGGHPIINGWRVPSCLVGKYPYGPNDDANVARADLYVEFLGENAYLTAYGEGGSRGRQGPYHVGEGEVYVMGDNRHNSHDSRAWHGGKGGGVPFSKIQGRAMFVWLPLSRLTVPVMGKPELPSGLPPELTAGIDRCLAQRPSVTLPPPPKARAR